MSNGYQSLLCRNPPFFSFSVRLNHKASPALAPVSLSIQFPLLLSQSTFQNVALLFRSESLSFCGCDGSVPLMGGMIGKGLVSSGELYVIKKV